MDKLTVLAEDELGLEYEVTPEDYSDFGELPDVEQLELGILKTLQGSGKLYAEAADRWDKLYLLQGLYPTFDVFLLDMYEELFPRFNCTDIQLDMGEYLENGPLYRMIQAQRGQAKTTITAAYAVWRLIHNPATRILIFSAGGDMASQIALWVIQIIQGMELLEPLRPDVGNRERVQRSSVGAFDVHWQLKGPEKSPSVACLGITANMQGYRADVLIGDDIESSKNSTTETEREKLRHRTRDFTSINSTGDIIYLGTPQTSDSIYNDLPARGFDIRIWPGRYPTVKEEENYGEWLAPLIRERMLANPALRTGYGMSGDRGAAVDPVLMNDFVLTKKERDQGPAYFQLQHMLDTRLNDEMRFPLKSKDLMVMQLNADTAPSMLQYSARKDREYWHTNGQGLNTVLYEPFIPDGTEYLSYNSKVMHIDPAGDGSDEASATVVAELNGYMFVLDWAGWLYGIDETTFDDMVRMAMHWGVPHIEVERNFGAGMYAQQLRAAVLRAGANITVSDDNWASGQKEVRIADTLSPVFANHRVVLNLAALQKDVHGTSVYPIEQRQSYQMMYQITKLTRERGALIHDDRLDSLEGAVKYFVQAASQDAAERMAKYREAQYAEIMKNPLQKNILTSLRDMREATVVVRHNFKNAYRKLM